MSWYYAENNERRGPIDDAAFQSLVASGTVRPETLVWRDGLSEWVTLDKSGYNAAAGGDTSAPAQPAEGMGVCSESGRILPRSELVEINGRLVSAEYKNVVLQRLREGVGTAVDAETLAHMVEQRGYDLSIGACLQSALEMMKQRFWLLFGATFLMMLINQAAGIVPIFGPLLVFGPLTAGLYWLMVLVLRKEQAGIADAFVGFSRGFGQLLGYTAVMFGTIFACLIPAGIMFGLAMATGGQGPSPGMLVVALLVTFGGVGIMVYLLTAWIFGLPLIIDKQLEFWPAMKLSKRVVSMHWWKVFGIIFVTGLVMFSVMVCFGFVLFIGFAILSGIGASQGLMVSAAILFAIAFIFTLLAVMPLSYATVAAAYEQIFGQSGSR